MRQAFRTLALGLLAVAAQTAGAADPSAETICHVPRGNAERPQTLEVSATAARAHLAAHPGDRRGPCATVAGDREADGVLDWLDNCLDRANTDQRDTDRDGVGNACDPDFDNNRLVDPSDERLLVAEIRRRSARTHEEVVRARDFDLNADGAVDNRDLHILRDFLGRPPGPRLDTDGDGWADLEDPCFHTPAGARILVPGCSALDLVEQPGALVDPVLDAIGAIVELRRPNPVMWAVVTELDAAAARLRAGTRTALAGDPCRAQPILAEGGRGLTSAFQAMDEVVRRARSTIQDLDAGDVTEEEMDVLGLEVVQSLIGSARDDAVVAADALGRACASAIPVVARGTVRRIHDAGRRLELTEPAGSGRVARELVIGLSQPITREGSCSEAAGPATVEGLDFRDGTALATDVVCDATDPGLGLDPCLALRFAPVQPLPPFASGPLLLHDPRGYRLFGTFLLEGGMAVAVERTCPLPPPDTIPVEFLRYSADVTLDYTDRDGGAHSAEPVALELLAREEPARLPFDIDPSVTAILHVRYFRQTCDQLFQCSPKVQTALEDYPLLVTARGSRCEAEYFRTLFDVDDQDPQDFRIAITVSAGSWPLAMFEAEAYALTCNGPCAPQVSTIEGGDVFAIHNFDFYPVHPGSWLQQILAGAATGVPHAAGLKWPRVRGVNSLGYEFQYSCEVPKVVRDVVNFCNRMETHDHQCIAWDNDGKCTAKSSHTTRVNAFYRLPFGEGDTSWTQGQGNLTPCGSGCQTPITCPGDTCSRPTHFGGYAYDMVTSCDDDIRAARAGRVVAVTESNDKQLYGSCAQCLQNQGANCCPAQGHQCCETSFCAANSIIIRHQDGTFGQYVHMPKDGIVPEKGDLVRRGELVGWIGVTGRTSGPHVHFAERSVVDQCCSHLMLFEATDPAAPSKRRQCYEPLPQDVLRSNSQPWP